MKERVSVQDRAKAPPNERARAASGAPATDGRSRSLWFDAPINDPDRRPQLTRQRVVTEALAVIAQDGAKPSPCAAWPPAWGSPGALYHHVGNKQQLQDLVLDGVLAEVDVHTDLPAWTDQLKILATRLRQVLEAHPGVAGILKTRDPLGPHSLALAEGVPPAWRPLRSWTVRPAWPFPAGRLHHRLRGQQPCLRSTSSGSATAIRTQLHEFFRSLPPDRFPALVALGEHVWVDNRDQRFTAGLQVLVDGLEHARRSPPAGARRATNHDHQDHPRTSTPTADNQRGYARRVT